MVLTLIEQPTANQSSLDRRLPAAEFLHPLGQGQTYLPEQDRIGVRAVLCRDWRGRLAKAVGGHILLVWSARATGRCLKTDGFSANYYFLRRARETPCTCRDWRGQCPKSVALVICARDPLLGSAQSMFANLCCFFLLWRVRDPLRGLVWSMCKNCVVSYFDLRARRAARIGAVDVWKLMTSTMVNLFAVRMRPPAGIGVVDVECWQPLAARGERNVSRELLGRETCTQRNLS